MILRERDLPSPWREQISTPLIKIKANLYAKLETVNPTGTVKVDDYIFYDYDLPDTLVDFTSISDSFVSITGVVHYYFGEYVIYPRNWNDFQITLEECSYNGDANLDGVVNVIDIVQTVNVILDENIILTESELCIIDYNSDGIANVIDIVALVNLILGIE